MTVTSHPAPSAPRPTVSRSLEQLEAEIVRLASQITAASARLTALIGEFDAREGWRQWGMRSTAHWLSWQCGMNLGTAREHVRVARALRELPAIAAEYAVGRLSYAKVRALTRFATTDSDAKLAETGRCATGAQIERLARAARRARTPEECRQQYADASLTYSVAEDGSVVGSFRLPPASGAVFVRALEAGAGRLPSYESEEEEGTRQTMKPKRASRRGVASVLTQMAEHYLSSLIADATPAQAERFQLVLHATQASLALPDGTESGDSGAELHDGTPLHASTARRLSCDCPTTTMVDGRDGAALHVGRRSRRIGARARRAVDSRDRGRCCAPGCSQAATQIHHIRHWANGGVTCLRNLTSLCDGHHWLVHEGGFTLVQRRATEWALLGPTGITVEPTPSPACPASPLPHDSRVQDDAVTGDWDGSRMDRDAIETILRYIGVWAAADDPLPTDVVPQRRDHDDDEEWLPVWSDVDDVSAETPETVADALAALEQWGMPDPMSVPLAS